MGKKNRNRGGGRGRYDDMFDYAGGSDDDYQYSYQDEIDSAEFVEVENSQKDSRSRDTMHPTEKNTKSQAAEERESWDFIKAKMDQSLSRLGSTPASGVNSKKAEKSSVDPSKKEKEKKPKGPSVLSVFFGKMKSFSSSAFKKTAAVFKRKPKADDAGTDKPEKKSTLSGKDKTEKKPGVTGSAFSFLRKKTEDSTDSGKATRKKDETGNPSRGSTDSRTSKSTPESRLRERRRTYLIIGSVTMCIVLLLLTAGILFIVNHSGKSGKPVAQNLETSAETGIAAGITADTQPNDGLSVPVTTAPAPASPAQETAKETDPPSLDSDLDLPGLIDEPTVDPEQTVGDIINSDEKAPENTADLADPLDSLVSESETKPADEKDPAETLEQEEKTEDPLAELGSLTELGSSGDTTENAAENAAESADLPDLPSLTDSAPETDPLKTDDPAVASLQEETPSLNETATPEKEGKDSTSESFPSLLDLPESVSPGSTTVSPTLSRSEDQNQLPEEMGTPDGVTPGSNIESWNTPANADAAEPSASLESLALNTPDTDPLKTTSEGDNLSAALAPPADSPSLESSQPKKSKSESSLGDLGQLSDLDSSPTPTPSLDSDFGSGLSSPSSETSKGEKSAKYTNYTTLKDDTFWKISEKFYQTPAYEKALSRYNIDVVPDPNNLKEGTVLQIPDVNFLRSCYPTLCPQPLQVVQVPTSQNSNQTRGVQYYCAAEGDTLSLIAERLLGDPSRWPEIYRLNTDKVREMDLLPAGVKLLIPADDSIPEQNIWQ